MRGKCAMHKELYFTKIAGKAGNKTRDKPIIQIRKVISYGFVTKWDDALSDAAKVGLM